MKTKPKNFDEFRNGGSDAPLSPTPAKAVPPALPTLATAPLSPALSPEADARARENKTLRIRRSFAAQLRAYVFHRSNAEGRKVTESDIVDAALEEYFRNHPLA